MKQELFKYLLFLYRSLEIQAQRSLSYRLRPLLFLTLLCFFMSMFGILFREYRFFCAESQKIIILQQQYRKYLAMVKKNMGEALKSNLSIEALASSKKKTENYNKIITENYTSLNSEKISDFIVVNRQPVYLKQSMCSYFKGEELDFLLPYIDSQEWCDYNEQITISNFSKQKQKKKKQKIQTITCSWPIDQQSFWLSSLFGPRKKIDGSWGFHYGIDMAAMKGTPIKAAHAGNVIQAECVAGYGNTVVIQYNKNFKTRYAHLDTICVSKGQKIKKSNVIGTAGETGFIRKNGNDGSHLHFEVYKNGKQVDPLHNLPVIYGLI